MAIDTIKSTAVLDGAIATADIADDAVTSAKLVDDAVTSAKLDTNIDIAGTLDVTGATTLDSTLTAANDISINASSGNPKVSIKTAGVGNNPFTEYRAGDNTVFDNMGVFSNTPDYWRVGYGASGSVTTELMKVFKDGAVAKPLQPNFWVRRSANQTGYDGFTTSQWGEQYVEWDVEEFDIGGGYNSNGSNLGKFVAPVAGTYYFETSVYATNFSSGAWGQAWFNVNGGRKPGTDHVLLSSGNGSAFVIYSSIIKLNAGDNVAVHPYPASSSSTNVTILANVNHTWFKGILLS